MNFTLLVPHSFFLGYYAIFNDVKFRLRPNVGLKIGLRNVFEMYQKNNFSFYKTKTIPTMELSFDIIKRLRSQIFLHFGETYYFSYNYSSASLWMGAGYDFHF